MKILTLGNGFIANHLNYPIYKDKLSCNDLEIRNLLNKEKPDVIINCIGYCGKPNIDECEIEKNKTFTTNVTLPSIIASECDKLGIRFIHIGSGCIFYGQSPNVKRTSLFKKEDLGWTEKDHANPLSYYSKTKYACDLILENIPNCTVLRIRMPISVKNDSRNFINKIKNYSKIIDIPNSVTIVEDLVCCIDWVIKKYKFGVFNVTNPQPTSAAEVMRIYQTYKKDHQFQIISEKELNNLTSARRSNCLLNTDKLNNAGFYMSPTRDALFGIMKEYIKH